MANSKANIYPIQLQNAELNLNKYDAEIKQYSGFNKNNAPFVGGCLSNIFTKDETINGSNENNTFIDNEGRIYKLENLNYYYYNTWWLRLVGKNRVFLKGDSNKFLVNKKLNYVNESDYPAVMPITNNIYVLENLGIDSVMYGVKTTDGTKFHCLNLSITDYDIITGEFFSNSLDREKFVKNNMTRIFISPDGVKNYCVFAVIYSHSLRLNIIDLDKNENNTYNYIYYVADVPQTLSIDEPIALTYDEGNTGQIGIFYTQADNNFKFAVFFSIDFENNTVTKINDFGYTTLFDSAATETTSEKLAPNSLISYHVLNYPDNSIILSRQPNSDSLFDITYQTDFKIIGRLKTPYYDNGLKCRTKTVYDYKAFKTVATSAYIKIGEFIENGNSTRTPIIFSGDVQNAVSPIYNDNDFSDFVSWCVHQTNNDYAFNGFHFEDYPDPVRKIIFKRAKYALGDFIPVGKGGTFYFAMNNNLLSAICSKHVLLTEWNAIDAKDVYFFNDYRNSAKIRGNYNEKVYYKVKDEWYVIELEELPSLRVFDNQIVVNVDSVNNSYDYKRDKVLHFAIPYNSIVDTCQRKHTTLFYSLQEVVNTLYVGAAVNEYNQEDNSSIILNPVQIAKSPTGDYVYNRYLLAVNFDEYINIYSNARTQNSIIEYRYSALWNGSSDKIKIDAEKEGFNFPIDTNGNVEYNVNLFSKIMSKFATSALIKSQVNSYPLVVGNNNNILMNYYLASGVEGLDELFIIQGQYYGVINDYICSLSYNNGVVYGVQFVVNIQGLQYCGNTPYEALFYSKTNRCLYSFTGANILQTKQFVDKISVVKSYKYNPATQSIFLLTDIGVIVSSLFGIYQIDMPEAENMFLLDNGVVLCDNEGHYRYIRYYIEDTDEDYIKNNIKLETCYYGMNNQTVTVNDCLYMRLFSEEHEEGDLEISATTISNLGKVTEKTTFKIKKSDWDKETHTIYLRYQPKEQRGLGISFKMNSPFKIASLAVGSQPDAILIDKVSKGAINAPNVTGSNIKW